MEDWTFSNSGIFMGNFLKKDDPLGKELHGLSIMFFFVQSDRLRARKSDVPPLLRFLPTPLLIDRLLLRRSP